MMNLHKLSDLRLLLLVVAGLIVLGLRPSPTQFAIQEQAQTGFQAMQDGQIDLAYQSLESAARLEPGLGSLHTLLARLALLSSDPLSARRHLEEAEAWGADSIELLCLSAAIELWELEPEGVVPTPPLDGHVCESMGMILSIRVRELVEENQWQLADELVQAASDWEIKDAAILSELGMLQAVASPNQAVSTLTQAEELASQNNPLSLGLLRAIEDSRPQANSAYTLAQVGQTLARFGMWQESVWAFQHALQIDSAYVEARAYLGLAMDQIGEDGYPYLSAAESEFPNAALPHLFLGMHWSSRGDLPQAQLELEIAVGLDPTNPSAWAELGSVYTQRGLVAEAKNAFMQSATLAPGEWRFWFLLAQFSLNTEIEIAELALPAARNLITLEPDDPRSYDLLGYAHYLNGNIDLAERLLLKAISLQPTLASAHYHLGQLRRWQGRTEQSQAAFELALQLDPDGSVGLLARRALGMPMEE